MTDKEEIQVCVSELPENCYDCLFYGVDCEQYPCYCLLSWKEVGDSDENISEQRHSTCPLKTIKSVQNQRAIDELKIVKNFVDGRTYLAHYINQRIEELRGKNE